MRSCILGLLALLILTACNDTGKGEAQSNADVAVGDTIFSPTGLKFVYLEKGDGPRIVDGAKVSVYNRLYLNESDDVFWSTDQSKDSVFTFILGKTPLIRGARELYPQLREGDAITAIMPDSIAYGPTGSSGIPPRSTLVFNPIIVKKVSEPKLVLGDTLYAAIKSVGAQKAIERFEQIKSGKASQYHMELELLYDTMDQLANEGEFAQLEPLAAYFEGQSGTRDNRIMFGYFKTVSAEGQGNLDKALEYLDELIQAFPQEQFFLNYKQQLEQQQEQAGS